MKQISLLILFFIASSSLFSQNLLDSPQKSNYEYYYGISCSIAEKIYKNIPVSEEELYSQLVDSAKTDQTVNLKNGYYLKVKVVKNQLINELICKTGYKIDYFENHKNLSVSITDSSGTLINNARVFADGRELKYNDLIGFYEGNSRNNELSLICAEIDGFKIFQTVSRTKYNKNIKNYLLQIVYTFPIRMIYLPIRYAVMLIPDAIVSISNGYPKGTIYRTTNLVHNPLGVLKNYVGIYKLPFKREKSYFVITDKPQYHIGDTLYYKLIITANNKLSGRKKINTLITSSTNGKKYLDTLKPYRKGCYYGSIPLCDSNFYNYKDNFYFNDDNYKIYEKIKINDYKLNHIVNCEFDSLNNKYYFPDNLKFKINAYDENDLFISDAKAVISLSVLQIDTIFSEHIYVADTLFKQTLKFDSKKELICEIPSELIPKANLKLKLNAVIVSGTSNNKTISREINYYHNVQNILSDDKDNKLNIVYLKNGIRSNAEAQITQYSTDIPVIEYVEQDIPSAITINPEASKIKIIIDNYVKIINLNYYSAKTNCDIKCEDNILTFNIINPRKLDITYQLYKADKLCRQGRDSVISLPVKYSQRKEYMLMICYRWNGKNVTEKYSLGESTEKTLNIAISGNTKIFPGEKISYELKVTDSKGKAVKNADITVKANTLKFGNSDNDYIPGREIKKKYSQENNVYRKTSADLIDNELISEMMYKRMNLGKSEYYKFIFPENEIYKCEIDAADSITQFSPFVFKNGEAEKIHIIYVDYRAVYFSQTGGNKPWAFKIDSGYHRLTLRTYNEEINSDLIYFPYGKKVILSFDANKYPSVSPFGKKKSFKLTDNEKDLLFKYMLPFEFNPAYYQTEINGQYTTRLVYLENNGEFLRLDNMKNFDYPCIAGPVRGDFKFVCRDSFEIKTNMERGYKYNFSPGLVKLTEFDINTHSFYLNDEQPDIVLDQEVYTLKSMTEQWMKERPLLMKKKYASSEFKASELGKGIVKILNIKDIANAKDIMITDTSNKKSLFYLGDYDTYATLPIGNYNIYVFTKDDKIFDAGHVEVTPGGSNVYIVNFNELTPGSNEYVNASYLYNLPADNNYLYFNNTRESKVIVSNSDYEADFDSDSYTVTGAVFDIEGNPMPGVTIYNEDTNKGTISDLDGLFSINLQSDYKTLRFSFIGYKELKIQTQPGNKITVFLEEDNQALEEVVVVGYGIKKNVALTGKVSGISVSTGNNNIITDRINNVQPSKSNNSNNYFYNSNNENRIRNNFKDNAIWIPNLKTDINGKVKFDVCFPDDITAWNLKSIAVSKKGTSTQNFKIQSYKPVTAQLIIPDFAIRGDKVCIKGLCRNFTDSVFKIKADYIIDNKTVKSESIALKDEFSSEYEIEDIKSSPETVFKISVDNGYFDGERKTINVKPAGIEVYNIKNHVLNNDTTLVFNFSGKGEKTLKILSPGYDMINYLESITCLTNDYNIDYSIRLKALIALKQIRLNNGDLIKAEEYNSQIIRCINQLKKRMANASYSWSRYEGEGFDAQTSNEIRKSINKVYKNNIIPDIPQANEMQRRKEISGFDDECYFENKIERLISLKLIDNQIDYPKEFKKIIMPANPTVYQTLLYAYAETSLFGQTDIQKILKLKHITQEGDIRFEEYKEGMYSHTPLQLTILALKVLMLNPETEPIIIDKCINALYKEVCMQGFVAKSDAADFLDLLSKTNMRIKSANKKIFINGIQLSDTTAVTKINSDTTVIKKTGNSPVWITEIIKTFNENPEASSGETYINLILNEQLKINEKSSIKAEITTCRDIKYATIKIMIPAGCVVDKGQLNKMRNYDHYTVTKEYVEFYVYRLNQGRTTFEVPIEARFKGSYTINPVTLKSEYYTDLFARSEKKKIEID